MLWVPPGFAHGFLTLTEALVHYKVTKEYNKDSEGGLIWNDSDINVKWPLMNPNLSEKDTIWPGIKNFKSPFNYEE